jgi:TolA-binding protein
MKFRMILLGATALAISTPTLAQDANVEGRVVKLEKEMRAVQRQVFPGSSGKFFEPEIKPETSAKPESTQSSSAVSDLLARVDSLETQLSTLTGQMERQGNTMRTLEARLKALEGKVAEQNVTNTSAAPAAISLPQPKPAAIAPKPAATASKPAAKPTVTAKPSAARTAAVAAIGKPSTGDAFEDGYNYGYRLWEAKFYPEAQVQLEEVSKKYPKHSRISYVRNLLGRSWLDDGKPATAVKIFYDNYKIDPRGDRAPESLYFLGSALTDLNKTTEACEAFGQLETAYPDVAAGRLSARLISGRSRAKCK